MTDGIPGRRPFLPSGSRSRRRAGETPLPVGVRGSLRVPEVPGGRLRGRRRRRSGRGHGVGQAVDQAPGGHVVGHPDGRHDGLGR
jgi:hypothetical protein